MFTIFGATHSLTHEMIILLAALGVFVLGIIALIVDVIRRNRRRKAAENRPIDTSLFQQLNEATAAVAAENPGAPAEIVEPAPADDTLSGPSLAAPALAETLNPPDAAQIFEPIADPVLAAIDAYTPPFDPYAPQPVLRCQNFGAGFGAKVVLADVTFSVPDQGITTLMGPAGTGKTTLLRAIAGQLNQSGLFNQWGGIYYRGLPAGPENRPLLAGPRIQLVQRTALENLTFHLQGRTSDLTLDAQRNWASQWLEQAGVAHVVPLLDHPFKALDPLAQRIVTILREAAAEPALLMLDEPAAGLAEAEAAVLLAMLQRLAAFTPLLVALQSQKHARKIAGQTILLAGGQVQAACGTDEFFDTPPTPLVAHFIATGACALAAPEAPAVKPAPPVAPAAPQPLTAAALAAIKDEIRNTLAAEMQPEPEPELELEPVRVPVLDALYESLPDHPSAAAPPFVLEKPETDEADLPVMPLTSTMQLGSPPDEHAEPPGLIWIEPGRLAATPMPGLIGPIDEDLELLKHAGITALITLTEQDISADALARHGLRNLHFPIPDREAPSAAETDVLVSQMNDMLAHGEVLAVHCLAGLGRTGTVLAAYMVREKGLSAQAALDQIRHFNQQFVQTGDQEDFLVEYEVQQEQTDLRNRAAGQD